MYVRRLRKKFKLLAADIINTCCRMAIMKKRLKTLIEKRKRRKSKIDMTHISKFQKEQSLGILSRSRSNSSDSISSQIMDVSKLSHQEEKDIKNIILPIPEISNDESSRNHKRSTFLEIELSNSKLASGESSRNRGLKETLGRRCQSIIKYNDPAEIELLTRLEHQRRQIYAKTFRFRTFKTKYKQLLEIPTLDIFINLRETILGQVDQIRESLHSFKQLNFFLTRIEEATIQESRMIHQLMRHTRVKLLSYFIFKSVLDRNKMIVSKRHTQILNTKSFDIHKIFGLKEINGKKKRCFSLYHNKIRNSEM